MIKRVLFSVIIVAGVLSHGFVLSADNFSKEVESIDEQLNVYKLEKDFDGGLHINIARPDANGKHAYCGIWYSDWVRTSKYSSPLYNYECGDDTEVVFKNKENPEKCFLFKGGSLVQVKKEGEHWVSIERDKIAPKTFWDIHGIKVLKIAGISAASAAVTAIAVDQYNKRYITRKRDRYSVKKAALVSGLLAGAASYYVYYCC